MVPADSRRITRAPRYSGYRYAGAGFAYGPLTLYDLIFQTVPVQIISVCRGPTTPILPKQNWFGLFRFRSPLLAESLLFSSPKGT